MVQRVQKLLSEAEIMMVFETLGLATQERRDYIRDLANIIPRNDLFDDQARVWLSSDSDGLVVKPVKRLDGEGVVEDAKLEGTS